MTFKSLGLSEELLKAIDKKGYTSPSPIQEKAIPLVLKRKDVLASAQTGTGKTAGFVLPILEILNQQPQVGKRKIKALVLTPTRELAAQIYDNAREYSEFIDFRTAVIFGGVNQNPQVRAIKNGLDMLVATPGRLLDLISQKLLSIRDVEILVLDEADRMLDMGFQRDINKILAMLPKKRQNLLFSATFSKEIKNLANAFMYQPELVETVASNTTAERVDQLVIKVDKSNKADLTVKLIKEGNWEQVLIFTRTKHGANRLAQKLDRKKISAAAIHGDKSQNQRTRALAGFKEGTVRVLVATDIAARGLDIPLLPNVINYELPNVPEDYVHRIGRTGRAGASGEAVSLVEVNEYQYLKDIEKMLGEKIPGQILEGFEPTDKAETKEEKKAKEAEKQRQIRARREKKNSTGGSRGGRNNKSRNRR